jgi:hypothetical protein
MGYSYTTAGALCCDYCGSAQGTKRYKCPFGHCPATAACPDCRAKHKDNFARSAHAKCETAEKEYRDREAEKTARLAAGECLRTSALGIGQGSGLYGADPVHVIFRGADGLSEGYIMDSATYHAIPYLVAASPDDYRKHGRLIAAEPDFSESYKRLEPSRTPATPAPLRRPQAQLFGADEGGFCLVAEVATDGARIIREREEKARNQQEEAQKQKELF